MRTILASVALLALMAAGAHGAVTVLGDDAAAQCSQAAIAGKSDPGSEALCTKALNFDNLDNQDKAGTFVNRGVMKLRRGQFEASHADFDAAVALMPNLGEAWVNRGAMWVGEKRYQAGLEDLNRGLALGVHEAEKVYYNRALAYEGLDNEKAAYFDYVKATELKPDWILPRRELLRFHVSHAPPPAGG